MFDFKQDSILVCDIIFLILVLGCVFYVGDIERSNGRLEMCEELNMSMVDGICIDKVTYDNKNSYININLPILRGS